MVTHQSQSQRDLPGVIPSPRKGRPLLTVTGVQLEVKAQNFNVWPTSGHEWGSPISQVSLPTGSEQQTLQGDIAPKTQGLVASLEARSSHLCKKKTRTTCQHFPVLTLLPLEAL